MSERNAATYAYIDVITSKPLVMPI